MWIKIAEKKYLNMDVFVEVEVYTHSATGRRVGLTEKNKNEGRDYPINSPEAQAILKWLEGSTNEWLASKIKEKSSKHSPIDTGGF